MLFLYCVNGVGMRLNSEWLMYVSVCFLIVIREKYGSMNSWKWVDDFCTWTGSGLSNMTKDKPNLRMDGQKKNQKHQIQKQSLITLTEAISWCFLRGMINLNKLSGSKGLSCHTGCQEVSRCGTRGESEVNARNQLCAGDEARKWVNHPGLETRSRHHQKSTIEAPEEGLVSSQKKKNKNKNKNRIKQVK